MPPSVSQRGLFGLFLIVYLLAANINHLDDTDEVHGYWEVLHYLTYGRGLQTWEYAPQYAIRTYAYVAAMLPVTKLCTLVGFTKVDVFQAVRIILAIITAYSSSTFLTSVDRVLGTVQMRLTTIFLLFSPGVFYASTSFLPSASVMNLVMLGASAWLLGENTKCLLIGSVAVLLTGWPFVGVIFLPLGLNMWNSVWVEASKAMGSALAIATAIQFAIQTVMIAGIVYGVSRCVDRYYYGIWVDPTMNILAYNAGGNGDNLYGVESVGYYVRNLALTMGPAWPLSVVAPILLFRQYFGQNPNLPRKLREKVAADIVRNGTIMTSGVMWLALLFSRPHKEERFMYPVYPLLALMAAYSAISIIDMLGDIVASLVNERQPLLMQEDVIELAALSQLDEGATRDEKMKEAVKKRKTWGYFIKTLCMLGCLAGTVAICFLRCTAVYNNYGGFLSVWKKIAVELPTRAAQITPVGGVGSDVTVCVGGEWYRFASHFHLPENARLAYVKDTFVAQLPQYFYEPVNGEVTSGTSYSATAMNDRNAEEPSRYVEIHDCDYVVASLNKNADDPRAYSPMLRKMTILYSNEARQKFVDDELDLAYFEPLLWERVINPDESINPLARALEIPVYSSIHNKFIHYNLYGRVRV